MNTFNIQSFSSSQQSESIAPYMNAVRGTVVEKDFFIQQYFVKCLAEFSYYVESNGEALIIDPLREVQPYMELLETRQAKLKYILETHIHADFVSGHIDLSQRTGATIVYGPGAKTDFKIKDVKDGALLPLGKINIRVDHTPGHTPESSCFVLIDKDNKEYCVFTGDTLFLNEVGRPDLAVSSEITKETLAGNKLMKLPDECVIYPGHGAGSSCGKSISAGDYCTLGNQKQSNYALQPMSKEDFVKILSNNIPKPPQYFFHDAAMNKSGPIVLESLLEQIMKPLTFEQFQRSVQDGALILDTRYDISQGVIDKAINISIKAPFATWVGTLIKPTQKLVVITDPNDETQIMLRLARIGYQNIVGYLNGGFESYTKNGGKSSQVTIVDLKEFMNTKGKQSVFLDVRSPEEWKNGVLPNSLCIALPTLSEELDKIPPNTTLHIYCGSSVRGKMAMSIIKNAGKTNDFILTQQGGYDAIIQANGIKGVPR